LLFTLTFLIILKQTVFFLLIQSLLFFLHVIICWFYQLNNYYNYNTVLRFGILLCMSFVPSYCRNSSICCTYVLYTCAVHMYIVLIVLRSTKERTASVGTAACDSFGSCTSACQNSSIWRCRLLYIPVGCLYLASSFARRKRYTTSRHQAIQTTGLPPSRIMCTYPVKPTLIKKELYISSQRMYKSQNRCCYNKLSAMFYLVLS
jgi:hypothetical protein